MLTLVLGGARSGKSRYAQSLCVDRPVRYIATAQAAGDAEMIRRIERHRTERPGHWKTIEAPFALVAALGESNDELLLVDCITVWLSNLSYRHRELRPEAREKRLLGEVSDFVEATRLHDVIAVSNDVGSGIVPESPVAREFRDLQGLANQIVATAADKVFLMVAGIPTVVKG
jgi:adenosylcobinamide kinase/adenosylcobinamide-phosphate guanylyltransferase